jgi:hypothetical protein
VIPRRNIEPVVREILGIKISTIAAAAIFIAKLFPSAVWVTNDLMTTESSVSEIGIDSKSAN